MEKKRRLKKDKRYVNLILMLLLFVLISGIVATDYALRDMMALFDGGRLFTYQQQGNLHHFEVFGDQFYIDQEQVVAGVKRSIQWGKVYGGNVIEKVKQLIMKMSG
ncbi:hypothetical protein [Alkaliphilus hydrothermalis]|uniref:Uncharacterized protein n=1 Tax=Alkaliphilus hydrothermalis TaxID=1482730 RepID=A0ABS2NNZ5_9FIRM|nr:hypothetical protein [Alkaliphilus hydrothermalis]MBM7614668.1 hypothetical protein [Alkaliphilus hydrothermalis]